MCKCPVHVLVTTVFQGTEQHFNLHFYRTPKGHYSQGQVEQSLVRLLCKCLLQMRYVKFDLIRGFYTGRSNVESKSNVIPRYTIKGIWFSSP